jgi:oligopeptide transport system substrate-binding protein
MSGARVNTCVSLCLPVVSKTARVFFVSFVDAFRAFVFSWFTSRRAATAAALVIALAPVALFSPGCGGQAAAHAAEDEGLIVLRRSEGDDPKSLDPHVAGDVISSRHCGMTYECLFQYDYLAEPPQLVPALAREKYEYDAETLTYTFRLRDDVYFQADRCFHPDAQGRTYREEGEGMQSERAPGRKLTAHDFVYSFKRFAAQAETGGYWILEDAQIKGLEEYRQGALRIAGEGPEYDPDAPLRRYIVENDVEGLRALDDYTFQVELTRPYPQFVHAITLSYGAAVAREAAEYYGKQFFRKPVGTGPFTLTEWRSNWRIVWERNPDFREEFFRKSDDPRDERFKPFMGQRLPLADRAVFTIVRESQARWLNFRNGLLDFSGLDRDQYDAAITPQGELTDDMRERGIGIQRNAEPTLHYIAFNMNDPVVGTPARERGRALRRAMALCIDRRDYIRRYLNGRGQPATQITPPNMIGHFEDYASPSQRHDPEEALRILREAGFNVEGAGANVVTRDPDTGRQVTVNVLLRRNNEAMREYARFLRSSGLKIGVIIESELMTFPEWLQRTDDNAGQIFDAGWVMDYPDAQNMLQLLYGPNRPPGINNSAYESPEFDRAYSEMVVLDEADPEKLERKLELIRELNEIFDRDVPWILMENREDVLLHHQWWVPPKPNYFAYTHIKFEHADTARRSELAVQWTSAKLWPQVILGLLLALPLAAVGVRIVRQM